MNHIENEIAIQVKGARASWDAASRGYAAHVAPKLIAPFVSEIIQNIEHGPQVSALEVAAGSGALTTALAQKVGSLHATDISPKMINLAKAKCESEGLHNVRFSVMDGEDLAIDTASLDQVVCGFGLMLFTNRHQGFCEMKRVLRSGGKAVISAWADQSKFEAFSLLKDAIQMAIPNLPKPPAPPPVFSLSDPNQFKDEFEYAGFKNVSVGFVTRETKLSGLGELWKMMTSGAPPVQKLFDKVGPDGKERINRALSEIVTSRWGNGPITISNTATLAAGVNP